MEDARNAGGGLFCNIITFCQVNLWLCKKIHLCSFHISHKIVQLCVWITFFYVAKQENIRVSGVVEQALPNAHFTVRITDEGYDGHEVNAHISGKMRLNYIKILPGDDVILELTPFDLTKGRIVYRGKEKKPAVEEEVIVPESEGGSPETPDESPEDSSDQTEAA